MLTKELDCDGQTSPEQLGMCFRIGENWHAAQPGGKGSPFKHGAESNRCSCVLRDPWLLFVFSGGGGFQASHWPGKCSTTDLNL